MNLNKYHDQTQERFIKESKKLGLVGKIAVFGLTIGTLFLAYNTTQKDSVVFNTLKDAVSYKNSVTDNSDNNYQISKLEEMN